MNAFDWRRDSWEAMLTFAHQWAPYGGGAAARSGCFGVSERVFFLRLAHLLTTPHAGDIDELTRSRLGHLCTARLTPPGTGDSHHPLNSSPIRPREACGPNTMGVRPTGLLGGARRLAVAITVPTVMATANAENAAARR